MSEPSQYDSASSSPGIMAAAYPTSPPLQECLDSFWKTGPEFETVPISIEPPETPLELLERLGPSPFERGGFPLIGFLATTYDKVSRYALERRAAGRPRSCSPGSSDPSL